MTMVLAPVMAMALELSPSFAPEAVAAYKIKAEVGEAEAQFLYAWALSMGSAPGKHNPAVAFDNAKKSAGQGFELAYRLVGLGYAEGWNGSSNAVEAAAWYGKFFSWAKPAAEKGNAWAQLQLGQCYEKGRGIEKNPKEAAKWYRKAAEQGCAIAQTHLSLCYGGGVGVERDELEEQKWERKAAELGEYSSQVNLGLAYGKGYYGERDPVEAVKWYRKAAEQGFSQAQCLLGLCYRRGIGVEINHAEAVKWYRKAANDRDRGAQYRLWLYYVNGDGVKKNLTEAVYWYCKLAKNDWQPLGDPLKTDELFADLIGEKAQTDNMQKVYDSLVALGKGLSLMALREGLKDWPVEVKTYYEKDLSFAKGKLEQEKKSKATAARAGSNSSLVRIRPAAGNRRAQRNQEAQGPDLKEDVDGYTWTYRVSNGGATIRSVAPKPSGDVSIPQTLGGVPVKVIGASVFRECEGLTSVIIPDGVVHISNRAFYGCRGLASVKIPSSVTRIGWNAFEGCRGLASVKIPSSVTSIGVHAFEDTSFYKKQSKGMVILGGGVLYKFKGGCSTSVTIPSYVTSIGESAFSGCKELTSVTIPSSVTSIGRSAFSGCSGLTTIVVDIDNPRYKSIDDCLLSKDGIMLIRGPTSRCVVIPKGVMYIGEGAFSDCKGLTSVTIPSRVTSIGDFAFRDCSGLTSVTIPSSVTSIGRCAFYGCRGMMSVMMRGERPDVEDEAFARCNKLAAIHVPANAKSWAGVKEWQGKKLIFDDGSKSVVEKISVAEKLCQCDFLINKDFKKNAKFYLCLFSASWCPPCRREMPRIAKAYAETLKDDPDIELIHFSRDQNDEKALAWAKEHDVKFPVVKPKGGNPLDLHTRGIPHLFIIKADGTLVEEGHPMKLFTEERLRKLK